MKYPPKYVLFYAASRYLTAEQRQSLIDDFGKEKPVLTPKFHSLIKRYFNYEDFKDKPIIWQDLWLYNYLTYDVDGKLKRHPLLIKYHNLVKKELAASYDEFRRIAQYLV
jgi:hypothetical protein